MVKKILLLIMCFSCNQPKTIDTTPVNQSKTIGTTSVNQVTRIKTISSSVYSKHEKEFLPSRERTINYSKDNNQLEYLEYKNGKQIVEKHVATYQDNKLISDVNDFAGIKYKYLYEYNHFGDLVSYIYANKERHYQDTFIYANQKLINHSEYAWEEGENKKIVTEENYNFDSDNNTMDKIITSPTETKTIKYAYNSEDKVISKVDGYKQYKIDYQGDTLINIEKKEGISSDYEITNITIEFATNGLLNKVVIDAPYEKNIFNYVYDENKNLTALIYTEEFLNGTKDYVKHEFGPYNIKTTFIFPSWFVSCGVLNSNIINDVDFFIKENQLKNTTSNRLNRFFKSFPDYYVEYHSKDGIEWNPISRMDFKFETIKH